MVDEAVVGDGVEPRGEPRARRVAAARLDDAQPHVLVELLGLAARADRAQHEPVQRALVLRVQGFERTGVASCIREHELFVGGRHASVVYLQGSGAKVALGKGLGSRRPYVGWRMPRATRLR